jgi:hypothetical protein
MTSRIVDFVSRGEWRQRMRSGRLPALLGVAIVLVLSFTTSFSPAQTTMELTRWREFSYARQTSQTGSRITAVDAVARTGFVVLGDGGFARLSSSLVHTSTPDGREFYQGYVMYDFDDASSILAKVEVSGEPRTKQTGSIIYLAGTKRFKGITGRGTISSWMPAKWDLYTEVEASYAVPKE